MLHALLASALWAAAAPAGGELPLALSALREGERARAEKVLGPLERLPLYRGQLEVDVKWRSVSGRVQLRFVPAVPLQRVLLRVGANAGGRGGVQLSSAKMGGAPVEVSALSATLFALQPPAPLPAGAPVEVELSLKARVPRLQGGSQRLFGLPVNGADEERGAFFASADGMALVGLVPQLAPLGEDLEPSPEPLPDADPALFGPAHFVVSVSVPRGFQAHAVGVTAGELPEKSGRVRYTFAAALVRDFPVLVTRPLQAAQQEVDGVVVESRFGAADAKAGKQVLAHAAAALSLLQGRLGPYPYARLTLVELPLPGGGGLELSGLVALGPLCYRAAPPPLPGLTGAPLTQRLARSLAQLTELTVAHEVAHQYFPGVVGSDPTEAPFADEPLAQYLATWVLESRHGAQAGEAVRQEQLAAAYQLFRLMGGEDGEVARPAGEFDGTAQAAALLYGKGPFLHHEERKLLGDEAFFASAKGYVERYRWQWACPDCWTQELMRRSPNQAKELRLLRRRWWEEANGDADLGAAELGKLLEALTGEKLNPEQKALLEQLLPNLVGP